MSNLHSYLQPSKPYPQPICTSQEIRDRGSIFVANIFRTTSEDEARKAVAHLRNVIHGSHRATHEMYAWRCMVLKAGKTGLAGPDDFQVESGCEDDGERYGGGKILKIMQSEGIIDAVLVVSRWCVSALPPSVPDRWSLYPALTIFPSFPRYGGQMLGPARFSHSETCAREVSHAFRVRDEVEECVATLTSLDDILASLRAELASLTQSHDGAAKGSTKKKQDYGDLLKTLDLPKAKRLVSARENAIKAVKASLQKSREMPTGMASTAD